MITQLSQLDPESRYTYADYLLWGFQERVELIKGYIRQMAAPSMRHQRISGDVFFALRSHLQRDICDVFAAPFDVRLPLPSYMVKGDKIDTVVQPDLCVICDKSKLDERGCLGAPDLMVEILSPGNSKKEMREKYDLYQEAGVREYWVIDPEHAIVLQYVLQEKNQVYQASRPFTDEDILRSAVLHGFEFELKQLFL
jgi:Uma2 family endonuclease